MPDGPSDLGEGPGSPPDRWQTPRGSPAPTAPAQLPEADGSAPAPAPSPAEIVEPPERLRSALQVLGSVVAPTTLLTALLIYFGQAHAFWFFNYFGIDVSLLGLSTQDYVTRAVDALFVPLAVGLSVGLAVVSLSARLFVRLFDGPEAPRRLRRAAAALGLLGLGLFAVGMARVVVPWLSSYSLLFPLSLGVGTLLLLYASRLHRRSHRSAGGSQDLNAVALLEATGALLLVGLSLFWAATNYASGVGESRARDFERTFRSTYAHAIVYSKDRLHLRAAGVEETPCPPSESGYRYRYQGLRLMLRSGGQYFFLPDAWSRSNRVAIVIPEGDSVRLQFSRSTPAPPSDVDEAGGDC